ncbi:MAG: hypothetical protein EOO42_03445 [Flavobacteriales bacterium]|nr:MAG: hypothetical protein EOO42_03445 [Flavobacteriales bacterium]
MLSLVFAFKVNAQTAIEKKTSSSSAVLEFASGTTKGIILPAVESLPASAANGTFLFDKTAKIVKMYQNNTWVNLSGVGDVSSIVPYTGSLDNGKQVILGSHTTKIVNSLGNYVDGAVDGVLVLESPTKALVLPHVSNPHLTVKSPYTGMMCYDTDRKALAIFDGKVWNYWK